MYVVLWRFRARVGAERAFEATYGADGAWARLFRRDPAYLGSELLRGSDGTYLTIDRWASCEAWTAFREREAAAYGELDTRGRALTESETPLPAVEV